MYREREPTSSLVIRDHFETNGARGIGETQIVAHEPAACRLVFAPFPGSRKLQSIGGAKVETDQVLDCQFANSVGRFDLFPQSAEVFQRTERGHAPVETDLAETGGPGNSTSHFDPC